MLLVLELLNPYANEESHGAKPSLPEALPVVPNPEEHQIITGQFYIH